MLKRALVLLAVTLSAASCGSCGAAAPPQLPAGFFFEGQTAAVRPVLARLAGMSGTPAGEAARVAVDRLAACDAARGNAADLVGFLGALSCTPATPTKTEATWALPALGRQRFVGHGSALASGELALTGALEPVTADGFAATVALSSTPPTTSILRAAQRAVWLHLRLEDGFDPSLLAAGGGEQAHDLFAVNALMLRGLLDGELEVALYPPREGHAFPVTMLAIGIRSKAAGQTALDALVSRLEKTWSTAAHDAILVGHAGRCLPDVNILPEFAPCAIVTDDDLVIGWNAYAFDVGLADAPVATAGHDVVFDFATFVEADRRLEQALAEGAPVVRQPYPWTSLRLAVAPSKTPSTELHLSGGAL